MAQWYDFNPRSHERSDVPSSFTTPRLFTFQSTLPREERHTSAGNIEARNRISIHAPTRGATRPPVTLWHIAKFQSTLPREERHYDLNMNWIVILFQSTLPREERLRTGIRALIRLYFNPRSHERSDILASPFSSSWKYFNPRSHERSDSNIAQKICLFLYNTDNKYIIR